MFLRPCNLLQMRWVTCVCVCVFSWGGMFVETITCICMCRDLRVFLYVQRPIWYTRETER